jgi:hypothetical protein
MVYDENAENHDLEVEQSLGWRVLCAQQLVVDMQQQSCRHRL